MSVSEPLEPPDPVARRKAHTRTRIVDAASRLFRRQGFSSTSVSELMGAAGLTHGGFYAHFDSKTALLIDALRGAFAESRRNLLEGKLASLTGEAWREAAAARYLAEAHVDRPDEGCAIPSLAAEVSRHDPDVRGAFEAGVREVLDGMTERLGDRRAAIRALASWAGALALARAVRDPAFASEILRAVRDDSVT